MAHEATLHYNGLTANGYERWQVICSAGDFTTDEVYWHDEALDSANWHASQTGGTVVDPVVSPQ